VRTLAEFLRDVWGTAAASSQGVAVPGADSESDREKRALAERLSDIVQLNELHLVVIQVGALVFTVLFIVRLCLSEIRKMKRRQRGKP
jgi:hypothetical protein